MAVRGRLVIWTLLGFLLFWTCSTYYFLVLRAWRSMSPIEDSATKLDRRLAEVETAIKRQVKENHQLLDFIKEKFLVDKLNPKMVGSLLKAVRDGKLLNPSDAGDKLSIVPTVANVVARGSSDVKNVGGFTPHVTSDVIAILVFACNRPLAIKNHLDQLLQLRPSAEQFPVVVSHDCSHQETQDAIRSYGSKVEYIQQPDQSDFTLPPKQKRFVGYYKIARHYRWALNQTFYRLNYKTVIITEDDLEIAPDFFEYFLASYTLLRIDATLWCVSAWNDNGKIGMIENRPDLLYRTDFFPGLGWMLRREVWDELEPKWPITFWDDWLRRPEQRQERACIRPEISRTAMSRHGKVGVSKGLYFEKHLKLIEINKEAVPFTQKDLSYLLKSNYDPAFLKAVYASPQIALGDLQRMTGDAKSKTPSVRLTYDSKASFKSIAKALKLMDDFKAGVPRTAYKGVVPFMYSGVRVFLAPPEGWKSYDVTWN